MKSKVLDVVYKRWSRIDRHPPWLLKVISRSSADRDSRLGNFLSRIDSLCLPFDPLHGYSQSEYEVLVVAAPKDFEYLARSIHSCIAYSHDKVEKITVVVPDASVVLAREICNTVLFSTPVIVISEEDLVSNEIRRLLQENFPTRYGWMLQQFICLGFSSRSNSPGVLLLDADTIFCNSRVFLSNGIQVLARSLENHDPYFEFLKRLLPNVNQSRGSHVTHWMIHQPDIVRYLLDKACDSSLEILARKVISLRDPEENSPVSLDFEFYAQGVMDNFPDRVIEVKWGNTSSPSAKGKGRSFQWIAIKFMNYHSVSFHAFQ